MSWGANTGSFWFSCLISLALPLSHSGSACKLVIKSKPFKKNLFNSDLNYILFVHQTLKSLKSLAQLNEKHEKSFVTQKSLFKVCLSWGANTGSFRFSCLISLALPLSYNGSLCKLVIESKPFNKKVIHFWVEFHKTF